MDMYIIYWESSIFSGHGSPLTYSVAKSWVSELNKKYPKIKHTFKKC